MKGSRSQRIPVVLVCGQCGKRNYKTSRSAQPNAKVIEVKKYCPACGVHTLHKETK